MKLKTSEKYVIVGLACWAVFYLGVNHFNFPFVEAAKFGVLGILFLFAALMVYEGRSRSAQPISQRGTQK